MKSIKSNHRTCTSKLLAAIACVVCLFGSYSAFAAQTSNPMEASAQASVTAAGVVVDAQGQPVVGASVIYK